MDNQYLQETFSLNEKTAIITGGTGGIGCSLATALAKAGASIVSIEIDDDPNSESLKAAIIEIGGSVQTFKCDLEDTANVRACFQSIWEAGITPDILVNCAGVIRRGPCMDATDEDINLMFDVNVKATYVSCQEFSRYLLDHGLPGKIINIASVTAFQANINTSVYSATKGAVVQLTKAFSNELASKGIQVNCISPGFIKTPMTEAYLKDPKVTAYLVGRTPAARWGVPSDLDPAVLFLASPANTFTTGISLTVDGGLCGK